MKLIADGGSSKIEWLLCKDGVCIERIITNGFNPYYQPINDFNDIINDKLISKIENISKIEEIYYYGSGCSSGKNKNIINNTITDKFTNVKKLEIQHDLLAAARALCGRKSGIASILGTGMNSCKYDGENITETLDSLGFFFADEGSGAHLGKTLLTAYFKKRLSTEISFKFKETYQITLENVLNNVYNNTAVGRYLASFSPFILQNINNPDIRIIAENCFSAFFEENICRYENYDKIPCNIVGSIAYYYKNIIIETAGKYNIQIDTILKSPIEGLITYHNDI